MGNFMKGATYKQHYFFVLKIWKKGVPLLLFFKKFSIFQNFFGLKKLKIALFEAIELQSKNRRTT